MMQTAESCLRDHPSTMHRPDSAARRFLAQPEMRPVLVIVADVFAEKAFQMPFVEHDHVVEQILPAAFNASLRNSVLPRTSKRCELGSAPHRSDGSDHFEPKLLVAVKDQVFVSDLEGKCFTQLLDNPVARRITGNIEMKNAPTIMPNEEETVEDSESNG